MELGRVVGALRAGWLMLATGLVLGAGAALAVGLLQTPEYSSTTRLFVSTTETGSAADVFQGSQFSQQRVASYADVITGRTLAERVIQLLDLPMTPQALQQEISAEGVAGTVLLDVTVTDRSAQRAQHIANAIGTEFSTLAGQLESPTPTRPSPVKVTVLDPPQVASSPTSPKKKQDVALGMVVGLLVGSGVAISRARLDRSVKDAATAVEFTDAPLLGLLPYDKHLAKRHVAEAGAAPRVVEQYRHIRNGLQFVRIDDPPRVLLVSSAVSSEGRTTAVINLALALADADRKVTVVDADLRNPQVAPYLGLPGEIGLTNVLAGTADLADAVQHHGDISVLAAGPLPPNPGELLASGHMRALVEKIRGENDFVLLDAPPLLPVADASGLAVHVDGVLLVVGYGAVRTDELEEAAAILSRVGATTLGVVLNRVPPNGRHGSGGAYPKGRHSRH